MTDADIESTKAPLMVHLIELRSRLIKALLAFLVMFVICFYFAKGIYNILVVPFEMCIRDRSRFAPLAKSSSIARVWGAICSRAARLKALKR